METTRDVDARGAAGPSGLAPADSPAADGYAEAGGRPGPAADYLDSIRLGDCVTLMGELPARRLDLVVTDPPFAYFPASHVDYVTSPSCAAHSIRYTLRRLWRA